MSSFRALAQGLLSPAIDTAFGEMLTLCPQVVRPNFAPQPDAKRPVKTVAGSFSWKGDMSLGEGENRDHRNRHTKNTEDALRVISRRPLFSFAVRNLPYALRQGDQIWRSDQTGFEVTKALPDGVHRVEVHCVRLGLSSQLAT
jgi:hypothetical protein